MSKLFNLADFDEEARLEKEKLEAATKEAVAVFKKHFPEPRKNLTAPQVLAACIEQFDIGDAQDAGQLYLEWTVEHYVGRKVQANLEGIEMLGCVLEDKGFTEDAPFEFGTDHKVFRIPHESKLVFCIESQSLRYIYIFEDRPCSRRLHIRRYYDEYDFDGEKDEWDRRAEEEYKEEGIREAIKQAFWLNEKWSDCLDFNSYPMRPSLQYFKDQNFEPKYGDDRDIGYVLSYDNLVRQRADGALYSYPEISSAFSLLRFMFEEMTQ